MRLQFRNAWYPIVVTLSGSDTSRRELSSVKASFPTVLSSAPEKLMEISPVIPAREYAPISSTFSGTVRFLIELQFLKASSAITVTAPGMSREARDVQSLNTHAGRAVSPSGSFTSLRLLHPSKACAGSAVTPFFTVTLKCNHNVTGLTLTTFGVGIACYFVGIIKNDRISEAGLLVQSLFVSSNYDWGNNWFGEIFLSQSFFAYLAIIIAISAAIILSRTKIGLNLRACGENPASADAAGINVDRYRYLANELKNQFADHTKLSQVKRNGDLKLEGEITKYEQRNKAVTADGYSAQTELSITVNVRFTNNKDHDKDFEQSFTAQQSYDSTLSLNSVQEDLVTQMVKDLVEQIFNKAVADW